ncbi:MAG: MFS transporter [Dehalococcoidia bacterium]
MTQNDPFLALRHRDYRLLISGRAVGLMGEQMVGVAVGWELYERTGSAFALGLVGLVQVLPVIVFALPAGAIADQFDRRRVIAIAQSTLALGSLGLLAISLLGLPVELYYAALALTGCARAFNNPATRALIAQTVPPPAYASAATWSGGLAQLALILGPSVGGTIVALFQRGAPVFALNLIATLLFALLVSLIRGKQSTLAQRGLSVGALLGGLRFISVTRIVLAAITLDLFAVMLGGVVFLLPVYAKEILHIGPQLLGWLYAAPAAGAITMSFLIAFLPPFRWAGWTLVVSVALYGVAMAAFGLSTSFPLSLAALALGGAMDQVSVVIRSTLVLLWTPDERRGRVTAVEGVFINMSNQIGGFRAGTMAALFGPVTAVVGGGIGAVLMVAVVALLFPELRALRRLNGPASQ